MEIKDYRLQIDKIDKELIALLEERFDVAKSIAAYKHEHGLPILDKEREAEKIDALRDACEDEKEKYLEQIFRTIMQESRRYQATIGPEYGVLGRKLPYSFSPMLHEAFGSYEYDIIEKEPEELVDYLNAKSFKGINVTIPYKKAAAPLCDVLSDIARDTGSVNTIVVDEEGRLVGENTDYYGFNYALGREGIEPAGRKCLVLGSGGASATVCKALYEAGASDIVVISRSGSDNYGNLDRHADAEIIVNATPVGTYPDVDEAPLDITQFPKLEAVFDLVYNPLKTKLVLDAEQAGVKACSGLSMLVAQGAKASELFTGRKVSENEIENVIRRIEDGEE